MTLNPAVDPETVHEIEANELVAELDDVARVRRLVQDLRLSKNDTNIIEEISMRLHKRWEENNDSAN